MKSRKLMFVIVAALSIALVLPVQLAAQHTRYKLVDLGTLGGPNSQVNGSPPPMINNRGVVAGSAETADPCSYLGGLIAPAFRWEDGLLNNLGLLPGGCFSLPNAINAKGMMAGAGDVGVIEPVTGAPVLHADFRYKGQIIDLGTFGGSNSLANDLNGRGEVVGGAENTEPDPWNFGGIIGLPSPTAWHAFVWEKGVTQDLGTLGGPDSFAMLINEAGQVAGFSFTDSSPSPTTGIPTVHPFLWDHGTMIDVGTLGGTFGLVGGGLNNRGQLVGFSSLEGDAARHAFIWERGVLTDIGTLGGDNSGAGWINDAGQVIGTADLADGTHHAFVWRNGQMTDLGTVGGDPCSNGGFINARGQVIGTSTDCQGTILHIFLWQNGAMVDLSAQVLPGSGFAFVEPVAINDVGEIVGEGILPNGDVHAIVLKPCPTDCEAQVAAGRNNAVATSQTIRSTTAVQEKTASTVLERMRNQYANVTAFPESKHATSSGTVRAGAPLPARFFCLVCQKGGGP
jgi:probable HAF family extracellular repeat protein